MTGGGGGVGEVDDHVRSGGECRHVGEQLAARRLAAVDAADHGQSGDRGLLDQHVPHAAGNAGYSDTILHRVTVSHQGNMLQ